MATEAISLATAVGQKLRALRDQYGLRQDEMAELARMVGLDWTRSTVAALESARRRISADELLALPWFLFAMDSNFELSDLIPEEGYVELTPILKLRADVLRETLRGGHAYLVSSTLRAPEVAASGEPERRAARNLGVTPEDVAGAALHLWGFSLRDERDDRVRRSAGPDATEGTRRTLRGHVTRALLAELRTYLEARQRDDL